MINQTFLQQKTITTEQAKSVYPELTLTSTPNHDASLAAQVKHQFQTGLARLITNNIYRLTLSKNTTVMDKPELDLALAVLNLETNDIQYIEQNNSNIVVNLTVRPKLVEKIKKGLI